jgi:Holliday junction DNA helicase RuvB
MGFAYEIPMTDPSQSDLTRVDLSFELGLRPTSFSEYVGQSTVTERLQLMVEAARGREEALDHVLLSGPPGLGKTTLAYILGEQMGVQVRTTSGPAVDKAGDLAGLLTGLEQGDILFIDEIHRIPRAVEEYLYSAMEDYVIDILIDQGPNARSVRLNLPRFTLVGATTRTGLLSAPFRSRFSMNNRLDYYSHDDLCRIVQRSARILNVTIDQAGALEIASRSRGTPRIANNLLRWVRDYAQVRAEGAIDQQVADQALVMLEIDRYGLDELDLRYLETLIHKFQGGPVGISNLAVSIGEEAGTLEEVVEPYLIQEGYLKRTPQGRVLLPLSYERMGLTPPSTTGTPDLFSES